MGNTSIEWTDRTWSPLRARVKADAGQIAQAKGYTSLVAIATKMAGHIGPHCERVSHGCDHCYSDTNNGRCLPANGTGLPFERRARDLVDPFIDQHILQQPLSWKKPQKVFVENQSDLFGEWVTDEHVNRVFAVMRATPWHVYQILTKRPERMLAYMNRLDAIRLHPWKSEEDMARWSVIEDFTEETLFLYRCTWPLPNVWLGVSLENQATADARIPLLLQTPAAKRFVSYEPALGPVDFERGGFSLIRRVKSPSGKVWPGLNWVICGGESGPGARPFNIQWARNTIQQCKAAGVACFVKQLGANPEDSNIQVKAFCDDTTVNGSVLGIRDRKGGDWLEWSHDLRVREFPA